MNSAGRWTVVATEKGTLLIAQNRGRARRGNLEGRENVSGAAFIEAINEECC